MRARGLHANAWVLETLLAFQDLRSHVVSSPNSALALLALRFRTCRASEARRAEMGAQKFYGTFGAVPPQWSPKGSKAKGRVPS